MTPDFTPFRLSALWRLRPSSGEAYVRAIRLSPARAKAYARLGTVQARAEQSAALSSHAGGNGDGGGVGCGGDDGSGGARVSFEHAWRLMPERRTERTSDVVTFGHDQMAMALAGIGGLGGKRTSLIAC